MYFLVRTRVTSPLNLKSAKKILTALENPQIKVLCHYGFLTEPGGIQIIEVQDTQELQNYLRKFQEINAVTEIVPLMGHEETVHLLKRYIKKLEVDKGYFL
jgi:hypothetical protein